MFYVLNAVSFYFRDDGAEMWTQWRLGGHRFFYVYQEWSCQHLCRGKFYSVAFTSDRILSVKFSTSVESIKKNKSIFLCQQVSQVRDGYDTNNISGILKDFSQQTAEITSNENITSGDLGTSVEIITKVAAISAGREDLVTDSDTQVSTYTGHELMQLQQLTYPIPTFTWNYGFSYHLVSIFILTWLLIN